jgi:hypothetical protein
MRMVTIRQSLQHVVDNPVLKSDDMLSLPAHELVSRTLFEIANGAQISERGSMGRANIARNLIFTRLVGRRRPGTHPATANKVQLEFIDLTAGEISE